jgi:acyl-CoA thioester hydrolase
LSQPRPFQIQHQFPVRPYDVDFAGFVSNIVYVRWIADLRHMMLDRYLPLEEQMAEGYVPVMTRLEVNYKRPIRLFDKVEASLWVADLKRARWTVGAEYRVGDEVVAELFQQGVFFNLAEERMVRVPRRLRDNFEQHAAHLPTPALKNLRAEHPPLTAPRPLETEVSIPVRIYDIDLAGVVNNIYYVRWLEDIRLTLFDKIYSLEQSLSDGHLPVIVRTEVDYKKPVKIFDEVVGRMWLNQIGKTSLTFYADIEANGQTAVQAVQRIVYIDQQTGRPVPLPEPITAAYAGQLG